LGETKPRKIDARIICSSIEDLKEAVKKGKFRQDLYFRLNTFNLRVPPLRERKEDIPPLVRHFLKEYGMETVKIKEFEKNGTFKRFLEYGWPGNVRELENEIKRMVILARADGKGPWEFLPEKLISPTEEEEAEEEGSLPEQVAQFERAKIVQALKRARWNKSEVGRILGIPEGTVRSKMKKLGIPAHVSDPSCVT
jgi:DNA-binding NtrC family response regulator